VILPWARFVFAAVVVTAPAAWTQDGGLQIPATVEAGKAFSIGSAGSGSATLYIVGMGQVLKRDVHLGEATYFPAGSVYNAGHYVVILEASTSGENGSFEVLPADRPANLSFLARPSRLPVSLENGITGAVFVFDAYHNLITAPRAVTFEVWNPAGKQQERTVSTRDGAAWVEMNSTPRQGVDKFVAQTGGISSTRVVEQVPGDPCGLTMTAKQAGRQIELATDPVRDCSGNAVTDGTVVTFTESYGNRQSTVDVPIKGDIAKVEMPDHPGATISVASGVVMGNQIRWEK